MPTASDDTWFIDSPTKALDNNGDGSFKVEFNAAGFLHHNAVRPGHGKACACLTKRYLHYADLRRVKGCKLLFMTSLHLC